MQLFLCQASLPRLTSAVILSALVSLSNWRWLSIVRPMKAIAATTLEPMANRRACFLFMGRLLDADAGPVGDRDGGGVQDRQGDQQHDCVAEHLHGCGPFVHARLLFV